ncbi:MAG: hypothetical protein AVDCRST_MAG35-982, partial [uncultured Quadrisphaera sp.]
ERRGAGRPGRRRRAVAGVPVGAPGHHARGRAARRGVRRQRGDGRRAAGPGGVRPQARHGGPGLGPRRRGRAAAADRRLLGGLRRSGGAAARAADGGAAPRRRRERGRRVRAGRGRGRPHPGELAGRAPGLLAAAQRGAGAGVVGGRGRGLRALHRGVAARRRGL